MVMVGQRGFLLVLLILVGYNLGMAQQFRWPKTKALEFAVGGTPNGYLGEVGYIRYFQPKKPFYNSFSSLLARPYVSFPCRRKFHPEIPPGLGVKFSLQYEQGGGRGVRYRIFTLDAATFYLLYNNNNWFVSFKAGASIANNALLTLLQEGNSLNAYNQFTFGLLGGVEVEHILNDNRTLSWVAGWDQRHLFNSEAAWGTRRWYGYAGIRLKIDRKI